jgi:hypothetical protein
MKTELKQRIAFTLLMGIVTTGIISFTMISINVGFSRNFWQIWLQSWAIAYAIVIPAILLIGPKIQDMVYRIIKT